MYISCHRVKVKHSNRKLFLDNECKWKIMKITNWLWSLIIERQLRFGFHLKFPKTFCLETQSNDNWTHSFHFHEYLGMWFLYTGNTVKSDISLFSSSLLFDGKKWIKRSKILSVGWLEKIIRGKQDKSEQPIMSVSIDIFILETRKGLLQRWHFLVTWKKGECTRSVFKTSTC